MSVLLEEVFSTSKTNTHSQLCASDHFSFSALNLLWLYYIREDAVHFVDILYKNLFKHNTQLFPGKGAKHRGLHVITMDFVIYASPHQTALLSTTVKKHRWATGHIEGRIQSLSKMLGCLIQTGPGQKIGKR